MIKLKQKWNKTVEKEMQNVSNVTNIFRLVQSSTVSFLANDHNFKTSKLLP